MRMFQETDSPNVQFWTYKAQSSTGNAAGLNRADDQQQHRIHSNKM